eukprot:GGOE01002948.1.p1 GENE.GGOE01002948.1~~GGOE01002948.1.p1  ORF type:complete len:284 (-),score=53.56 GGOE01002948.1:182-928(-)
MSGTKGANSTPVPANFKRVWTLIEGMRKATVAPVDTMGCERLADEEVDEPTRRYQHLVSLMLSAQTRDEMTSAVMGRLKQHGLTVLNILQTSESQLTQLLYGVSFHNRKAKFIKQATQTLQDKFQGDTPSSLADVLKLPGVGPKMAHLFMQVAWGKVDGIGVDVHVHRISGRLGWVDAERCTTPEHTRRALEAWLPVQYWRPVNALLVGFGQTICRPVNPLCGQCTVNRLCPAAFEPPKKKQRPQGST